MLLKRSDVCFALLNMISYKDFTNITLFLLFISFESTAQITVTNPSFEDEPADATVPTGWWKIDPDTTPDILPGFWGVYNEASDGETYIGLITRPNRTWETIGQKLASPLEKGVCYTTSVDLAHSKTYAGYSTPIKCRIYIGDKKKNRTQLIFESDFINTSEWQNVRIDFMPESTMQYILIEAYHPDTATKGTEGNILIDAFRPIKLCSKA